MSNAQFLAENLKPGETYAGLILGKDGQPDYHLVLLPGQQESINWEDAQKWAESVGGAIPDRRESSLLFANCKEHFKPAWYWSCEHYAHYDAYAWLQDFNYGFQDITRESFQLRACAVRRIYLGK